MEEAYPKSMSGVWRAVLVIADRHNAQCLKCEQRFHWMK
jgi:hypothetical protein